MSGSRASLSVGLLAVLAILTFVIGGLSIWFADDPFEFPAQVLITSFAAGMTALALAIIFGPHRRRERWAWFALWVYPAFFLSHVAALGTYVPDLVLAAVGVLGLVLNIPETGPSATSSR